MEYIASYANTDSEDDSELVPPACDRDHHHTPPQIAQLPAPTSLFPNSSSHNQHPTDHQGRIRSFPHVEGNYATHVYISLPIDKHHHSTLCKHIDELIHYTASRMPGVKPIIDSNTAIDSKSQPFSYHISLSKTAPLRISQIQSLVHTLKQKLRKIDPFTVYIHDKPRIFLNEDATRTFLALPATCSAAHHHDNDSITTNAQSSNCNEDSLLKAMQICSQAFVLHGLPKYYDKPEPHVSIAWALHDTRHEFRSLVDTFHVDNHGGQTATIHLNGNKITSEKSLGVYREFTICCKVGQKLYTVWSSMSSTPS